jgi:hypothetical protein
MSAWKNYSVIFGVPGLALALYNALSAPHLEPDEFKEYPYLRRRLKVCSRPHACVALFETPVRLP